MLSSQLGVREIVLQRSIFSITGRLLNTEDEKRTKQKVFFLFLKDLVEKTPSKKKENTMSDDRSSALDFFQNGRVAHTEKNTEQKKCGFRKCLVQSFPKLNVRLFSTLYHCRKKRVLKNDITISPLRELNAHYG